MNQEDLSDAVHDSPVDRSFSPPLRIEICASPTEVSDLVVAWRHCSLRSEDGAEARSASQVSDRGAEACTAAVRVAVGDRAFRGDGGFCAHRSSVSGGSSTELKNELGFKSPVLRKWASGPRDYLRRWVVVGRPTVSQIYDRSRTRRSWRCRGNTGMFSSTCVLSEMEALRFICVLSLARFSCFLDLVLVSGLAVVVF
ncbi:hypothetical protein DY000_02057021 [Brassica cretica]|uniref:Uncharacterized protein n=1 Tax=Brassica cretica TaxID=69181 RepID=A0ABQ7ACU8_BRACR|nr:hypothetical protein DY000_02057021 [Brassica cretica]